MNDDRRTKCLLFYLLKIKRKHTVFRLIDVCVCPALLTTKATGTLDDTSTSSDGGGERLEKVILYHMCGVDQKKSRHLVYIVCVSALEEQG